MKNTVFAIFLCLFVLSFGFIWAADVAGAETRTWVEPITLNLSTFMPHDHIQIKKVLEPWTKNIEKRTGGELVVRIVPGSEIGKPEDHYKMAANGISDISYAILSHSPGRFNLSSVFELPFMTTSAEKMSVALWKVYEKYLRGEFNDVKMLWLFCQAPAHIFTRERPVKGLYDFYGLKIRITNPYIQTNLESFGATPESIPISAAYTALDKGLINGTGASFGDLYAFKQHEVVKYGVLCNAYTLNMAIVMNKNKFESLPTHLKKAIQDNIGLKMSRKAGRVYDETEPSSKEQVLKSGMNLNEMAAADLAKWKEEGKKNRADWVAEMKKKGYPGSDVLKMATSLLGIK